MYWICWHAFWAQTEQTASKCNSKGVQLTDGVGYKLYWCFLHFFVLWHEISSSFFRLIFPNLCSPAQRCPFLHLCCLPASWNPWLGIYSELTHVTSYSSRQFLCARWAVPQWLGSLIFFALPILLRSVFAIQVDNAVLLGGGGCCCCL